MHLNSFITSIEHQWSIPERPFPVDVLYTNFLEVDYVEATIVTMLQIHVEQPREDVLVFFTGQKEIESIYENLKQRI